MKKVTLRLSLELRKQKGADKEEYTCEVEVPAERATVEDFRPFILEKTSQGFGGIQVSRTYISVDSYDPATETVHMSHSLPRSKSYDFTYNLECNYGWRRAA